ncbi:unnamed protein product [Coffea canephora]|uniref:Uncharacterized protein n=1 Tax=Coffea canephora TaxID=49390 RepID=A0A068V445_COFCA|nr:unnamed protein product [Coffea canephora]
MMYVLSLLCPDCHHYAYRISMLDYQLHYFFCHSPLHHSFHCVSPDYHHYVYHISPDYQLHHFSRHRSPPLFGHSIISPIIDPCLIIYCLICPIVDPQLLVDSTTFSVIDPRLIIHCINFLIYSPQLIANCAVIFLVIYPELIVLYPGNSARL